MSTVSRPLPSSQTYSLVPECWEVGASAKANTPGPAWWLEFWILRIPWGRWLHYGGLTLVQGFSDMNFQFCCFRNISGRDLTDQRAPAWILLDLVNCELGLISSPWWPLDLAPEFRTVSFAGESQVKAVFPTQGCIFPTETKGKRLQLLWEEQEHYLSISLKLTNLPSLAGPWSFPRSSLIATWLGHLLRVWLV